MDTSSHTQNDAPFFSVVIPLYNKEKNIGSTIDSVLNQTFSDFELIVVDDGSTDRSAEIVASYDDPRIRLIKKENGGVSSARNRGVYEASAKWVALLDGDDRWMPKFLSEMKRLVIDFPDCVIYGSSYEILKGGSSHIKRVPLLPDDFRAELHDYWRKARHSLFFTSSSVVLKRDVALAVGGFDEQLSIGEDLDMWIRMSLNGKGAYTNSPLAIYDQDADNRAMERSFPYRKSIYYKYSILNQNEITDADFKEYLSYFMSRNLAAVLYYFDISERDKKQYLDNVCSSSGAPFWCFILKELNPSIRRFILSIYYKISEQVNK